VVGKSVGSEVLERHLAGKGMILEVILETQAYGMKICWDKNAPGSGKLNVFVNTRIKL
jgi:hypothetical protein